MKKILLPLVAIMLSMAACQKEDNGILRLEVEHYANDAKVHLSNAYAAWDNGDKIWINGGDPKTVTISGNTASIAGVTESSTGYKAIYPADWANTSGTTITYPKALKYETNDNGEQIINAPMVACAAAGTDVLKFKNVGSILAINVTGVSKVIKIKVIAEDNTPINGTATINYNDERPTLGSTLTNGSNTVILFCHNGVTVPEGGKTFYIAMPPVSAKLTIRVYGEDYYYGNTQATSHSMQANYGYNVPFNTVGLDPEPYGVFQVSADKIVKFAPGNLRYTEGATNPWSFCSTQYEFNYDNGGANGVWDYFGWSTDGPTSFSYGMSQSMERGDFRGQNFKDWGDAVNAQGNLGTGWRTFTEPELACLFGNANWLYGGVDRPGVTIGNTTGCLYIHARVNNVAGLILFPDNDFDWPIYVAQQPTHYNYPPSDWRTYNFWNTAPIPSYTLAEWTSLELEGCVFLPAAGYYVGSSRYGSNYSPEGQYWTSSGDPDGSCYYLGFNQYGYVYDGGYNDASLYCRYSVRLVRDVEDPE